MVILIAGASHAGKTLLAQRMLEEYGYPYLSIDHLKMGLIRSGNTDLTPEDDDELTDYLWPIVREMVKTAVENGQNLIVEGCYIPPEWRADFSGDYLRSIDFVCLAMSDAYIDAHYEEIISHGSDIEGRLDDSGCTRDSLKEDNRCCIDSFAERGERVAVIQSDFEEETGALLREFEPCRTPSAIGRSRNGYRRITEQLSVKRVVSSRGASVSGDRRPAPAGRSTRARRRRR